MGLRDNDIEIISAPSILGLRPGGVERLGESLLSSGLAEILKTRRPVVHIPTLNALYDKKRDPETRCMNPLAIREFSLTLGKKISASVKSKCFPVVLGGDCSILLGIMSGLKPMGSFGLVFLDAHADFYEPEKSPTGEVADMDLAIVTGRGPDMLTNINNQKPYVKDKHVIHIGQRDWEETRKYGSRDIRETTIKCFDLAAIEKRGMETITTETLQYIESSEADGFWIHFDTDVLADDVNPAVDYRLPGGLLPSNVEHIIKHLLLTGRMAGMSITIFNPTLDTHGHISKSITNCLGRAFGAALI